MSQHRSLYKQRGPFRKHLLTGFVYCVCGNKVLPKTRETGEQRYACLKIDHEGRETGCGKISRATAPLEHLVVKSVIYRLQTPQLEAEIARQRDQGGNADLSRLLGEQSAQQARLQEIMDDYGAARIDKREYAAFKAAATARLEALGREIGAKTRRSAPAGVTPGQSVRRWWDQADVIHRRQLLDILIERIIIHPSPGAAHMRNKDRYMARWRFDVSKIEMLWRV